MGFPIHDNLNTLRFFTKYFHFLQSFSFIPFSFVLNLSNHCFRFVIFFYSLLDFIADLLVLGLYFIRFASLIPYLCLGGFYIAVRWNGLVIKNDRKIGGGGNIYFHFLFLYFHVFLYLSFSFPIWIQIE